MAAFATEDGGAVGTKVTTQSPLVSIAVPTYNNNDTIAQCVESLASQDYEHLEVIVVDDGSTDGTLESATALQTRFPNVSVVKTEHSGPSHARNVGFQRSRGAVVLFADGDAVYAREYLKKSVDLLRADAMMGAVCVTGTTWIVKNTFVSRGIALEYEMKQKFLASGKWKPYFAFLYTRQALDRVGVYDETLFQGEDKDLFNRVKDAGFHVGLVRGFNWYHRYPQDLRSLVSRSYRGGKQRVLYVVKRRMFSELAKRTVGLWGLVILTLISPLVWWGAPAMVAAIATAYAYKLASSIKYGRGKGRISDILLLPVVSIVRYAATAIGYSKGSLFYLVRRAAGLQTTWRDV